MITTAESIHELWRYRELFYFMAWRDIKVRYKQSVLGVLWAVIQPFATMIVFTLLFNKLAKIDGGGIPYPIFSYSALLPWTYFSMTVTAIGTSLVTNRDLLTKVYFPRTIIPSSSAIRGLVDMGVASIMLVGMIVYYHFQTAPPGQPEWSFQPTWALLLWPMLLIPLVMFTLGVGMIFAALNVKYRDVRHALPFFVQMGLFLTPVIYPTSRVPESLQGLIALNPLCGIIESFRTALLAGEVNWPQLGTSLVVTAVVFCVGILYFRKTERSFADIV